VTFNDAMMLLVFLGMAVWFWIMCWLFAPGADERWCDHSLRRVCEPCRRRGTGVDTPGANT